MEEDEESAVTRPPGLEDPISAIFELSDRAAEMAPAMRRMYRATAAVILLFLVLIVLLLFGALARNPLYAVVALAALVLGGIALTLLRDSDRFYRAYLRRHRSIKLLEATDAAPPIPQGPTAVQRLSRHLAQSNDRIGALLGLHPDAPRFRVDLTGDDPPLAFDLVILASPDRAYRWFRMGDPGFAVVARLGPAAPTRADLEAFARDVGRAARRLPAPVVRAILLRAADAAPLSDEVYDYAVGHPAELRTGPVPLEILTESPDGTYDCVPFIVGVP